MNLYLLWSENKNNKLENIPTFEINQKGEKLNPKEELWNLDFPATHSFVIVQRTVGIWLFDMYKVIEYEIYII